MVGSERFVGRLCHRRAALSLMRRRDAAAGGALGLAGRWACASAPVVPSASGSFHTEVVIFSCKYERAAHSGSRGGKRSPRPVVAPENPARRAREVGQHAVGRHLFLTAHKEESGVINQPLSPGVGRWRALGHHQDTGLGPCASYSKKGALGVPTGISHHHQ